MNAKWHIINHLACAVVFLSVCSFSAFSQERDTIFIIEHDTVWMDLQPDAVIESQTRENRYDRRVHRYRRHWEALIPTHTKIQFAGNMGLLSFGTGWDYGRRNQWETDVFFGVLPKYDSKRTKLTFTVKQNYLPWSLQIKQSRFSVEPLACGMYLNTVFGDEFWVNEPERYPKGYYGFSSKVRIHAFLGQRITYDIDPQRRFTAKEITFFYEISTCDLYVVSAFTNKYLKPIDQQIAKTAKGIAVWTLIAGIDAAEIRKRTAVDCFCCGCLITQVVKILQQIQPQHDLQRIGFVAALSFVIARMNHGKPFSPRDDPLDLTEKFFFLRPHLRQFIAECGNCHLFIHKFIISHSAVFGTFFCAVLP